MTETVSKDVVLFDKDGTRVVLLSRSFGNSGGDQEEMRVRLTDTGPTFFHFFQDGPTRKYDLTAAEMDAACESWLAYRAELRAKEEAEKQRQEALIAEACDLTAKYPAIKLETDASRRVWLVSVPSIAWGHQAQVDSPQDLLELVKGARDAYQNHQKLVAGGDAA